VRVAPIPVAVASVLAALLLAPGAALAQQPGPEEEGEAGGEPEAEEGQPFEEGVDPTRLDVERLPPEAIEITRDLYSHGFFVEGWIGGRGFMGGVGRISDPGLLANVGFGFEIFELLWLRFAAEGSLHATNAPSPPSPGVFELLGATVELRLQINFGARFAIWLGGEGGVLLSGLLPSSVDVLESYGLDQAKDIGLMYGGTLGIDWHLVNRHYSMGILGGARLYPTLDGADGERAIGIHGATYLRYVF